MDNKDTKEGGREAGIEENDGRKRCDNERNRNME